VSRKGEIAYVIVGSDKRIWIPDLSRFRQGEGRLKGLRCIHTHLRGEPLSQEDITDMLLLGLDLMACVRVGDQGMPGAICYANILPHGRGVRGWEENRAADIGQLELDFIEKIYSIEDELARVRTGRSVRGREKAVLIGVTTGPRWSGEQRLDELEDLARSDGIDVAGRHLQQVKNGGSSLLIGKGKLSELSLECIQTGSNLLIFDNDLSPAQVRSLTDITELKIIDRTQLILDIFARRAVTREGKIQVELAQFKYLLPRLATKNTAMSRLTGGIGGRGPGETKLEINRRRVYSRIAKLNRELASIRRQRKDRRRLRKDRGLPVISIVGYTNAGKSTLLNAMTRSRVNVGNRLFETLDPSSRRLRFPREREAIITDTVGFIRDIPESLMDAFEATLEELNDADLLLHVVDSTSPLLEVHLETVEKILARLGLGDIPRLLVLNKSDLIPAEQARNFSIKMGGIATSAISPPSLYGLLSEIESFIWPPGRTNRRT